MKRALGRIALVGLALGLLLTAAVVWLNVRGEEPVTATPLATTPDGVQTRIQAESARWSAVIKTAGIQLDQ